MLMYLILKSYGMMQKLRSDCVFSMLLMSSKDFFLIKRPPKRKFKGWSRVGAGGRGGGPEKSRALPKIFFPSLPCPKDYPNFLWLSVPLCLACLCPFDSFEAKMNVNYKNFNFNQPKIFYNENMILP